MAGDDAGVGPGTDDVPGGQAPLVRHDVAERDAQEPPEYGRPLPLGKRATIACVFLLLTIPIELWVILTDLAYIDIANQILDNQLVTSSEIDDAENAVNASSIAQIAAYLITATVFLFWFARAYYNLPRFSLRGLRFRRGWSIGAWFVPILNLFRPKGIANDIWRGSVAASEGDAGPWRSREVNPLLHWWWAFWLATSLLSQVAGRLFINAGERQVATRAEAFDALRDERIGYWIDVSASAISIVAAVLAVAVIRRITALQDESITRV